MLLCTSTKVSPESRERISQVLSGAVDWEYLLRLADFHSVTPLIAYNLIFNGFAEKIPRPYPERLQNCYNSTLYRNVLLTDELKSILAAFARHGIPVISLKGVVLAEILFENPGLRAMSDIDILVRPESLPKAGSLLNEMGYEQSSSPVTVDHPFHGAPYFKESTLPFSLELHWALEDPKFVSPPLPEIWRRAQTLQLSWGSATVLSPEDALLFSILQLCKKFNQLKVLGDITGLLKKYEGVLDWDYLVASARSWGIESGVYHSVRWAQRLLEAPAPLSAVRSLKPRSWRRWALGLLVNGDNFISPVRWLKLRVEILCLVHSLMLSQPRQMLAVLAKHRGYGKRAAWLRTIIWIIIVFIIALGNNLFRFVRRKGSSVQVTDGVFSI